MSIKIIKQGVKEFHITCPFCGCEFTYENEDVHEGIVSCPCCGAILDAKQLSVKVDESPLPTNGGYGTTINPNGTYQMPVWYNPQFVPDGYRIRDGLNKPADNSCKDCPNNPKYLKTPYVGDYPCQWCPENPWKITCTSNLK